MQSEVAVRGEMRGLTLGWGCGIVEGRKTRLRVVSTFGLITASRLRPLAVIFYSLSLKYERAAKIVLTTLVMQVITTTIISTIMQAPFNPVFRLKAGRVRETDRLEPSASIGLSIAWCVCLVKWEWGKRRWGRLGCRF